MINIQKNKIAKEKMRLLHSYLLFISLYLVRCITQVQEPTAQECGLSLKERRNNAAFSNTGNINTTISKYPWTAAILKYKGRAPSIFCGGSLISRKHIVTAGHCVIDQEKNFLKVVLGATDAFLEGKEFDVKDFQIHPDFAPPKAYFDIAIIELGTLVSPLDFLNIFPICLPKQAQMVDNWKGQPVAVTGYGSKPGLCAGKESTVIHYASLEVLEQKECAKKHFDDLIGKQYEARRDQVERFLSKEMKITNELLCTISRSEELGTCPGDSGGPLTIFDKKSKRFLLIGAVRGSANECSDLEFPSLFARLEDYEILKFVRKQAFGEDILEPDGVKVCEKSNPCQNGANCVTLRNEPGYKCNCPKILTGKFRGYPSYTGTDCEEEVYISRKSSPPAASPALDQVDPCIVKLALKAVNDDNEDNAKTVSEFLQECILKSKFDIELILILGSSEDPTCDGPCKCVPFRDCNWSKKMFEKMGILSKNGLAFKTGLRFFKNRVCDYSKRHVYCCTGDQHPSETLVKKLKSIEPCVEPISTTPGGIQNLNSKSNATRLPRPCSSFDGRRCVPSNQCESRSGLEVAAADEGTCPNDSDICCSEDEIDRECSDYSPDGYKCVQNCFDLPQDEPSESEQLSNISPFLPKEAKCPKGELCCKRLEKPNLAEEPNLSVCEDQPGFKCTDFDLCDPNTFLAKPVYSEEDLSKLIDSNLFDSNPFGGITVNKAKSPCKTPTQVCCKPIMSLAKRRPSKQCSSFNGRRCVPENQCGGNKVARGGLFGLEAADEAICPNEEDTCCSEDEIIRTYPEDIMCSAIDGYICASPFNCRTAEINENNLASCSDVDDKMICCSEDKITQK